MSSLVFHIYPIMYNLVSTHCQCHLDVVHTCIHHLLVISNTPYILYYLQFSFRTLSPHTHIVNVVCILFTDTYVMYISFLLLLFAYAHVIHILSENMCIMCTLSAVVLDIFLPNRQCQCHPYVMSSTLYISYHLQLIFRTLSTQTQFVNAIWMLSAHVHIICLSSLTLLVYLIIHNLVSTHTHIICTLSAHTHTSSTCHLHIICSTPHGHHGPKLSFYSDRIWLLNGICHKNVELFHFRII